MKPVTIQIPESMEFVLPVWREGRRYFLCMEPWDTVEWKTTLDTENEVNNILVIIDTTDKTATMREWWDTWTDGKKETDYFKHFQWDQEKHRWELLSCSLCGEKPCVHQEGADNA